MLNGLLLKFFISPSHFIQQASAQQWTHFLQQAREQGMTARYYYLLDNLNLLDSVPLQIRQHGQSAAYYAEKQQHSLYFELQQLEPLFAALPFPCLLLKGAAYRVLALSMSYGRIFADIDLLVPAAQLRLVRDKLFFCGFSEGKLTDYDRHYYLHWSHQNPPIQHFQRHTVIDLHHHIYPTASAKQIDINPFFEHAEPLKGSAFLVPKAAHLFIHAAVHLFYQEETHKLIKDVIDLNDLLLETAEQQQLEFLMQQAKLMAVESAVINACFVLAKLFSNPTAHSLLQAPSLKPQPFVCQLLIQMLRGNRFQAWYSKQLWFVRGHGLKMRWQILIYHALAKPVSSLRNALKRA